MFKKRLFWLELLLLLIITIPSFISLLNNSYFSMHDNQHVARLFLLDQAIHQGYFYPRWVGTLGFSFGYPLFNFYPPLIYYIAEAFHAFGLSFIWSIKATFILGFFLSAVGAYSLGKVLIGRFAGIVSSILYVYFFYHAVLIYVRGALAEFFALAILPFVFLTLINLARIPKIRNALFFGISSALLLLCHPLISFPFLFYLVSFGIFLLFTNKIRRVEFIKYILIGSLIGLSLSAFFWLPSIFEKKYTLTDEILTRELASYRIHYVCLKQFFYSQWGYGGSIEGCNDGMTFQLGKPNILFLVITSITAVIYWLRKKKFDQYLKSFTFFLFMFLFSLFMTTQYSAFIWDRIPYLWYIQFPWRFLTFAGLFAAISASYGYFFIIKAFNKTQHLYKVLLSIGYSLIMLVTIFVYVKYYKPQYYITTNNSQLTSFKEIAWNISRSSFEFVPKGISTTKSSLNTTIVNITPSQLQEKVFEIQSEEATTEIIKNDFRYKSFNINLSEPTKFQLNTFYFPGWKAYLDNKEIPISPSKTYKLISVKIPQGSHNLNFIFEDTPIRKIANATSLVAAIAVLYLLLGSKLKQIKRRLASRFNKPLNKLDR